MVGAPCTHWPNSPGRGKAPIRPRSDKTVNTQLYPLPEKKNRNNISIAVQVLNVFKQKLLNRAGPTKTPMAEISNINRNKHLLKWVYIFCIHTYTRWWAKFENVTFALKFIPFPVGVDRQSHKSMNLLILLWSRRSQEFCFISSLKKMKLKTNGLSPWKWYDGNGEEKLNSVLQNKYTCCVTSAFLRFSMLQMYKNVLCIVYPIVASSNAT